jgi:hypothetical protein
MTEIITSTTTLTNTQPVVLLHLSSGNTAMVAYTVSVGEVMIAVLLVAMLSIQVLNLWRNRR